MFDPPRSLPVEDRLPLGTWVAYSHRAAVIRWKKPWTGASHDEWIPGEGVERHWRPPINVDRRAEDFDALLGADDDSFYSTRRGRANKSVLVWPAQGQGLVIGLVRRAIGVGWSPSGGGSGLWGEVEYEPGGFEAEGYVWLYAVKTRLEGTDYYLVPPWAADPSFGDAVRASLVPSTAGATETSTSTPETGEALLRSRAAVG